MNLLYINYCVSLHYFFTDKSRRFFNWYTLTKLKSAYYVFKQIILCIAGIYS